MPHSTPIFIIRSAQKKDAEVLGIVGPAAYASAYADIWEDAPALVDKLETFSAKSFANCLAASNSRVLIAEQQSKLIGYLTLLLDSASPLSKRVRGAEITRFYLRGPASGQGIGKALFWRLHQRKRSPMKPTTSG